MSNTTRDDLLSILHELSTHSPDVRLGQLIVNLAYLAKGPCVEAPWDVEDEELLAAAQKHLEKLAGQPTTVS